jgi:hypothetical protein
VPLAAGIIRQATQEGENLKPFLLARPGGGAYLTWARRDGEQSSIWFAVSKDASNYSPPLRISSEGMHLDLGAESGPQAAIGPNGAIHVVWVAGSAKARPASHQAHGGSAESKPRKGPPPRPGNLNIYHAFSADDGRSFSAPKKINDDPDGAEHRFPAIAVDTRGVIHVVWLDKRQQSEARPDFSRVYYARSTDGGRTFSKNVDATQGQEHGICHCCKLALAVDSRWGIFVAFRNAVGDMRDIYLTTSRDHGASFAPPIPVERTQWNIPGCPMDGPSLAFDKTGQLHAVWMTRGNVPGTPAIGPAAEDGSKVLYRRFDARSQSWSESLYLAAGSHPRMAVDPGGKAYIVWKQDGLHLAQFLASRTDKVQSILLSAEGATANFPSLAKTADGLLTAWQQPGEDTRTQVLVATVVASSRKSQQSKETN